MFTHGRVIGGILVIVSLGFAIPQADAQTTPAKDSTPPKDQAPPPPAPTAVAATVNGQVIPELAVYRGIIRANPKQRDEAAKEILNYLIDNVVVDQYLTQLKIQVEAKEIEQRIDEVKNESKKAGQEFDKLLKSLHLTEEEMRKEVSSSLRWDKFVLQQGTDKVLKEMFDKNKNMFDGSQVHARHILIGVKDASADQAKAKLAALRKQIEDESAQELAKLPTGTDNLAREKERIKAIDKAFAAAASKESTCPSNKQGGDLGWFPRAGAMVEPFARAAFALKLYQMSDVVNTEFGYHLILATDSKPGKEVKFEEMKPFVLDVYADRLREAIIAQYKTKSKIVISEKK
ncbi:MAG: peptidylprolyl isomerase [Planctomycetes bacterium]|nr:peptidylprolyl isomerase [Planctomycetota bacterium]